MKRLQSVKAEFDPNFSATSNAGGVLVEKVFRRLNLKGLINKHLPKRSNRANYSMGDAIYALMAGLVVGGRGIRAAEALRDNDLDQEVFGLEKGIPSEATLHNVLGEMAGLAPRKIEDAYGPAGPQQPSLDIFGQEKESPKSRRIVPDEPEEAACERLAAMWAFTTAVALRCLTAIKNKIVKMHGYTVVFGDATDCEVEGRCFDAAEVNYAGNKVLRWLTLMVGSITVAEAIGLGARDEAKSMLPLLERALPTVNEVKGLSGRVLALLDAAYFRRVVIEQLFSFKWKYIVCANRLRNALQRVAEEMNQSFWHATGPDASRGWVESQFAIFAHRPQNWAHNTNIIAVRWRVEGDLPGIWRYSFLATNLEVSDLPRHKVREHGFARFCWMLYATKQGRENHYKTPLRDFNLHHPPSSRLGINQAFYAVATAATNVANVIRYRVVQGEDQRLEFWRFRERYMRIAGYLVRTARTLKVRLTGASTSPGLQELWLAAFAEAGNL